MPEANFTTYQPPGVYVSERPTAPTASAGFGPGLLALVGPSLGLQTHSEAIVLTGVADTPLSQKGGVVGSVEVTALDGTLYASGDDYTVTSVEPEEGDTGTTADNITNIKRTSPTDIGDGDQVIVTYNFVDVLFTQPRRLRSFDEVRGIYGDILDIDGNTQSPLSLAAKIAFDNGASEVVVVSTETAGEATAEELEDGIAKLSGSLDVGVVVPVTAGIADGDAAAVLTALNTHCVSASAEGLYRVGICGFGPTVVTEPDALALTINSRRTILVWPNAMLRYNSVLDAHEEIGGYYLAAALGGIAVANDVENGLTNQSVKGFTGIAASVQSIMTPTTMNEYATNGVTIVFVARDRRLTVRHGLTTAPGSIYDREIGLVRAKDAMFALMEDTFVRSGMIGKAINSETLAQVKGLATGGMEQCLQTGLITGYTDLGVRQASADPTVIEVAVEYGPPYPVNYISLVFAVSTVTGAINETGLSTAA